MNHDHANTGWVEKPAPMSSGASDAVRHYWRTVVVITLACTLAMLGWSLLQPKVYTATATGIVVAQGPGDLSGEMAGYELARSKATSYWSLAISEPVAKAVIDEVGLNVHHGELIKQVVVETPTETSEVHVTVEGESPDSAVMLADAWIVALAQEVASLEGTTGPQSTEEAHVILQPLSAASPAPEPTSPRIILNMLLGLFIGLMLSIFYILFREKLKSAQF